MIREFENILNVLFRKNIHIMIISLLLILGCRKTIQTPKLGISDSRWRVYKIYLKNGWWTDSGMIYTKYRTDLISCYQDDLNYYGEDGNIYLDQGTSYCDPFHTVYISGIWRWNNDVDTNFIYSQREYLYYPYSYRDHEVKCNCKMIGNDTMVVKIIDPIVQYKEVTTYTRVK